MGGLEISFLHVGRRDVTKFNSTNQRPSIFLFKIIANTDYAKEKTLFRDIFEENLNHYVDVVTVVLPLAHFIVVFRLIFQDQQYNIFYLDATKVVLSIRNQMLNLYWFWEFSIREIVLESYGFD